MLSHEVEAFVRGIKDDEASLNRVLATILITDVVGSTERAAELGDRRWSDLLESHHRQIRTILARYRGHEIDTAGDGFLTTFDGPARAVRCAVSITQAARAIGLEVRAGIHTGEIELSGDEIRGIAVHIAARIAALPSAGEVLVSSTVKDLVAGSGLAFADSGIHALKGVPEQWHLYRVAPG